MTFINKIHGNSRLIMASLFMGQFCDIFFTSLIPALFVDISRQFGVTVALIGQTNTLMIVVAAIMASVVGPVSDRLGRKTIVIAGLVLAAVSFAGMSLSSGIASFIFFSLILGFAGAMEGPSQIASIPDYFKTKNLGRVLAGVQSGSSIGTLIGLPIAVYIAGKAGWQVGLMIVACLALLHLTDVILILPFVKSPKKAQGRSFSESFKAALKWKPLVPLLAANILSQAGFFLVFTYLIASLMQRYSIPTAEAAPFLPLIGAGQFVGFMIGGQIADRFERGKSCAIAQFAYGSFGFLFMFFSSNIWLSVIFATAFILVWSLNRPVYLAIISLSPADLRSTVMGIQSTFSLMGRAIGIGLGGLALTISDYSLIGILCLPLSFIAGALFYRTCRGISPATD